MRLVKGAFGLVGSLLFGRSGGGQRPLLLPKPVTRDDAIAATERDDELRRRRGSAADILTGARGAEASAAQIGRLVVGS